MIKEVSIEERVKILENTVDVLWKSQINIQEQIRKLGEI